MADYEFKGYDNFVLENKIDSILSTKMDVNRFMTPDYSLAENPGMIKKVHKYVGSGNAEDLARGEGNSEFIDAEYTEAVYEVARTQGQAKWYDDDAMTDPTLIDTKVQTLAEAMVNNWTAKAIAEFDKTSNQAAMDDYTLGEFADAIAKYANVYETQEGLFFLASMDMVPVIRKSLGDYLKYTEAYIRTGAIGDILGVPIYTSKAVPSGMMFLATREAVKAFIKKNTFVEQDRDIDKKENKVVASRYSVIALVDESKCIKCGAEQATKATITTATKATSKVAGAATSGADVVVFVNGVKAGHAEAASSLYEVTISDALVAGDKVKVVAKLAGKLDSVSEEFTVAA